MARRPVMVRLTVAQALRGEKLATYLWPQENLSVEEISRRLLEHLLWAGRSATSSSRCGSRRRGQRLRSAHYPCDSHVCFNLSSIWLSSMCWLSAAHCGGCQTLLR